MENRGETKLSEPNDILRTKTVKKKQKTSKQEVSRNLKSRYKKNHITRFHLPVAHNQWMRKGLIQLHGWTSEIPIGFQDFVRVQEEFVGLQRFLSTS